MAFDEGKVKRDEKGRFAEQNSSSKAKENEAEIANDYVEIDTNSGLSMAIKMSQRRHDALGEYMERFVGKQFAFHDGLYATVNKKDKKHLVSGANDNRIAELIEFEALIEKSKYDRTAPSDKGEKDRFSHYRYYVVKVKNGNEFIDLNINVGFHKQFRDWHIYTINVKEKNNYRSGTI